MCGIFGWTGDLLDPDALGTMARVLEHRGPDGEGLWHEPSQGVALGNRRLAIIDPERGGQPITNEDGTLHLVWNGELYDHRRWRAELEGRGHVFRSVCDAEVVVHLYEELGEGCVERLGGMFAFALWDGRRQRLLLARDAVGQKPLFYRRRGQGLVFASEIKALEAVDDRTPTLDTQALWDYLSLRFVPAPRSLLEGVEKLPPGHWATWCSGSFEVHRFWDVAFSPKLESSDDEILATVRGRLVSAVESHLESDVPVGTLLSGGLDSSMVAAIARRDLGRRLPAFAIGSRDPGFDELPWARQVARHLDLELHEEVVEPDLLRQLPRLIWHLDEPSDPVAVCMDRAAGLASRHVKVALGGDGGDELFAGFDRYWGVLRLAPLAALPAWLRSVAGSLLRLPGDRFTYKGWIQKARWAHQLAAEPSVAERYAAATLFFRFDAVAKRQLAGAAWPAETLDGDSRRVITEPFERAVADDVLDRMLYSDLTTRLSHHSLMLTDRTSMAHGLELRAPFLDRPLVETLARVPSRHKMRGRRLKVLLRRLAVDYLPREVVERDKQGFMFPVAAWLRGPLHGILHRALLTGRLVADEWLRPHAIEGWLDEHRRGRVDHHVRLWMLLNVELWYQLRILRWPLAEVEERLARHARA